VTPLHAAAIASEGVAAVAGIVLAVRRREHVPAAVALSLLAVAAAVQAKTGSDPWLVMVDRVVLLGEAAVPPALAVSVFLSPRLRRPVLACVVGAWLVVCLVVAVVPPPVASPLMQRVYLGADLAGLAVSIASFVTWAWWARGRASLGSAQSVAVALVLLDLGILLAPHSPWRSSVFASSFDVTQVTILTFFAVVATVEVILWRFSKAS
jgi:hypothetical protein